MHRNAATPAAPIDLSLARAEWRLLDAVERYKACCAATSQKPNSLDAWLVFLSALAEDERRVEGPAAPAPRRPAFAALTAAA